MVTILTVLATTIQNCECSYTPWGIKKGWQFVSAIQHMAPDSLSMEYIAAATRLHFLIRASRGAFVKQFSPAAFSVSDKYKWIPLCSLTP